MNRAQLLLFSLTAIGGALNTASGCTDFGGYCTDDSQCCKGICQPFYGNVGSEGTCYCAADGWSLVPTCYSNLQCCNGFCNAEHYCGCIQRGNQCKLGNDGDCCGYPENKCTCASGVACYVCWS